MTPIIHAAQGYLSHARLANADTFGPEPVLIGWRRTAAQNVFLVRVGDTGSTFVVETGA